VSFGNYLRGLAWVEMDDPDLPGESLVSLDGGGITLANFETNIVKKYDPIVPGQPKSIQSLEIGPDGKLYSAGYLSTYGSRYDFETGEKEEYLIGQAEGM